MNNFRRLLSYSRLPITSKMMIQKKFMIRNFSRIEPQKLSLLMLFVFILVTLAFVVKISYVIASSNLSFWFSSHVSSFSIGEQILPHHIGIELRKQNVKLEMKPVCDVSAMRSVVCQIEGDIRIHGNSSSILFSSQNEVEESWLIKPHARKEDRFALSGVTEVSVKSLSSCDEVPQCGISSSVPAIVFSTGGYMGNPFHDFTDVLIPLFITSFEYKGEVRFLIREIMPWWINKYQPLLSRLSRYEIVDLNQDDIVRCYPTVIVGLKFHKEMSIDPSRSRYGISMLDFSQFVRTSFALPRNAVDKLSIASQSKKPRLLLIDRKWTRKLVNVDEVAQLAKELGYEVIVADTNQNSNLTKYAQLVNSCDVLMGVHGAGLTNLVFLPVNATVIQVVPLGQLDELSWHDFGAPALDMNLNYLQYSITDEESTLIEQYPKDHPVFKDPDSIIKQGWPSRRSIYLVKQNVKLDVVPFRSTLLQAREFLRR